MKVISFAVLLLASSVFASTQMSETFIINFYGDHIKVVSPSKKYNKYAVIITNHTLRKTIGRLQTKTRILEQTAVRAGESKSFDIPFGEDPIFYYPLAPAFQEVELLVGKGAYEIPPQR